MAIRCPVSTCPPFPWFPSPLSQHLVASEDVCHLRLRGQAHPDVREGCGIIAQSKAHLYLDRFTGQVCGGEG